MIFKKERILWVIGMGICMPAFGQIQCSGWVGPNPDASGSTAFALHVDTDNSDQTMISGSADGVDALLLYDKDEGLADFSVSDLSRKVTVGSHAGFSRSGLLDTGFSLTGVEGKPDRHVAFECHLTGS